MFFFFRFLAFAPKGTTPVTALYFFSESECMDINSHGVVSNYELNLFH